MTDPSSLPASIGRGLSERTGASFSPRLDTPGRVLRFPPDKDQEQTLKALFQDGQLAALKTLEERYRGASFLYGLPHYVTEYVDTLHAEEWNQQEGLVFAVLDYYYARVGFPRSESNRFDIFVAFVHQRQIAALRDNLPGLLDSLATLQFIPDEWIPKKSLEKMVERDVLLQDEYKAVQVELTLQQKAAGGFSWMAHQTTNAVQLLEQHLEEGMPCPIALCLDQSQPLHFIFGIAYAYRYVENGRSIYYYTPSEPRAEQVLRVTEDGAHLTTLRVGDDDGWETALGFWLLDYTPVHPPLPPILRQGTLAWFRRILFSLFRWIRSWFTWHRM